MGISKIYIYIKFITECFAHHKLDQTSSHGKWLNHATCMRLPSDSSKTLIYIINPRPDQLVIYMLFNFQFFVARVQETCSGLRTIQFIVRFLLYHQQ
jgi:hypothetical protein